MSTLTLHPLLERLHRIIREKKTRLALSADLIRSSELLSFADELGPLICVLKTHIDIVEDFTPKLIEKLQELADRHDFLLFEDRKFADIGNTVKHQYGRGIYRIADWAHIANAHILPGPGVIEGLKEEGLPKGRGLLLIAEMSSKGNLLTPGYTEEAVRLAKSHPDFVIGFISTRQIIDDPRFIHMTPGVKLEEGTDHLGQQYLTPETVLKERKSDILIVGRGILSAPDPVKEALRYRDRAQP